ncbi:alpha-hydroxy acid oxidase [Elioraea sp.]|uniref:alpha-hydroxy acid oxidase n=1 Tax=Elioraea sp. TaxID=2185103 RepID=UPI0025C2A7CF|nr:alpha-hydroxy acid oxidase [Elioraea sp.]
MRAADAINIADLKALARRRLPRILFDVIESGVEDERGLARNEAAFRDFRILPRYLVDVRTRDPRVTLFGRRYAQPFGIAPTGFAGLFRRGADAMLARAAAAAGVPFILSGACVAKLEDVAAAAPGTIWYHLYAAKDPRISEDLIRRAAASGIEHLVLTVDNPVYPKRERDMRNGFSQPLKLRPSVLAEALLHPGWIIEYLRGGGLPSMETWAHYAPQGATPGEVGAFFRTQSPSVQTWHDLDWLRSLWAGRLIIKGIQHPDDARQAVAAGVDGIIVSNHGGKAFDPLPSPIETLPAVRAAVPPSTPVMLDSGVTRGTDIVIAHCLGADFVFTGRAPLYGVIADGEAGAARAIAILADEIDRALALMGCPEAAELSRAFLLPHGDDARRDPAPRVAAHREDARPTVHAARPGAKED